VRTSRQEALWVLRAQCADREALEALLRHVQPSLRRYLAGVVGASDADDVLQEVLLLIYRNLRWLEHPELFRPWAFRIASRGGFRHVGRRRRGEHIRDEALLDEIPDARVPFDERRVEDLLRENRIPPGCGAVLTLHFQEEMSLAEVAAVLELPLGTVKSRLAYGLEALRKRMGEGRRS